VNAILGAWHERHVSTHVDHLVRLKAAEGTALERLEAVLGAYAAIQYERPGDEVAASLHSGPHVDKARRRLERVVSGLISDAADDGAVRGDVDAGELARFCLHALTASSEMRSRAAVRRLITVTMTALRPET
jgi:hypothetical protein